MTRALLGQFSYRQDSFFEWKARKAMLSKRIIGPLKFWELVLGVLIAAATVIGYLVYQKKQYERCQAYVKTAEEELSRDNFDKALEHLQTASEYCDDKDVKARQVTVETFKVAAAYDQVKLVKDPNVLTKIDENLRLGRKLIGDTAELRVLQGVYEELSDRPGKSLEEYQRAIDQRTDYASAYNSWGYTIFKWKLGGSGWSDNALKQFEKAAALDRNYGWPQVNTAVVYLELAENALSGAKTDFEGAKKYLPSAKTSLEKAEKLLPDSPRVDLLWGHYYVLQARIFSGRGLKLDADNSYYKATEKLIQAKNKNKDIADIKVLLGSVYLAQGMLDQALAELSEAVKLDDMNITACTRLVYGLSQSNHDGHSDRLNAEVKRGLAVIESLRQRFNARLRATNDPDAKEWLTTAIAQYEPLEKFLKESEQARPMVRNNANRKPK